MLSKIRVGNKVIGKGEPVFITSEIGQNHNGDVGIALDLINISAYAKVDAVKFCKRNIDKTLLPEALKAFYNSKNSFGKTYGEHRKKLELSEDNYLLLRSQAKKKGLIFYASVCDEDSVDVLENCDAEMYKIASRDLVNLPLLEYVAKKGKPIMLSTGMSNEYEIEDAVSLIKKYNKQLILMHCTSQYPSDYDNLYLKQIPLLEKKYHCLVGFSGHSIGILMPLVSIAVGAIAIEKHITFDRKAKGTDHAGALEVEGLRRIVRDVRNIESALKQIGERETLIAERSAREKLGKGLVAKQIIKKGEMIKAEMLTVRSPPVGMIPRYAAVIVGRKAIKTIQKFEAIGLNDVGLNYFDLDFEKLKQDLESFEWKKLLEEKNKAVD